METLIGFAVGFVVGTREGREGMARITDAYKQIRKNAGLKDLVGIQNCVHVTGRAVRLHLDPAGERIERATVLESYNPLFDGVTTAAVAGDELVLVATVQFRKMGKGEPFDPLHVVAVPLSP